MLLLNNKDVWITSRALFTFSCRFFSLIWFYFCVSSHINNIFSSAVNHLIFILPCAAVIFATLIFISVSVCCPLQESGFVCKTLVSDAQPLKLKMSICCLYIHLDRTIQVCPPEANIHQFREDSAHWFTAFLSDIATSYNGTIWHFLIGYLTTYPISITV